MGDKTGISWTESTWNPLSGCRYASPGCLNCYAQRETHGRLSHLAAYAGLTDEAGKFTGRIRLLPERLDQPLRWKKPRRVFVNSMSDLFHHDVPFGYVCQVFAVMGLARQHQFQVLTKRPQRMRDLLCRPEFEHGMREEAEGIGPRSAVIQMEIDLVTGYTPSGMLPKVWLPNVWLGTSIESDSYTFRADYLRQTPAAVRFLSCEPLIGPLPSLDVSGIDWVIVGSESGPGMRPMDLGWVREIRDKCVDAKVAFFVKQLPSGTTRPLHDMADFPEDLRIQEWPA